MAAKKKVSKPVKKPAAKKPPPRPAAKKPAAKPVPRKAPPLAVKAKKPAPKPTPVPKKAPPAPKSPPKPAPKAVAPKIQAKVAPPTFVGKKLAKPEAPKAKPAHGNGILKNANDGRVMRKHAVNRLYPLLDPSQTAKLRHVIKSKLTGDLLAKEMVQYLAYIDTVGLTPRQKTHGFFDERRAGVGRPGKDDEPVKTAVRFSPKEIQERIAAGQLVTPLVAAKPALTPKKVAPKAAPPAPPKPAFGAKPAFGKPAAA